MSTVQAWQHIYTNVEEDQSPTRRSGFQTLFWSHDGLADGEVEDVEASLVYTPSPADPVKRLFFTTSAGKVVVGQVVSLPGADRLGREGRYFAHSLLFDPHDFVRVGGDPFALFARFPFLTTVAAAARQGDPQTGSIPRVTLSVGDLAGGPGLESADAWGADQWVKMAALALQADDLAQRRLTVAVVGDRAEVEHAIAVALLAVPPQWLTRCTFDTYFEGCNPVANYYWAVGLAQRPSGQRFVIVDASARQVQSEDVPLPDTSYARWLRGHIEAKRPEWVARHKRTAVALCEWLDGLATDDARVDGAEPDAAESVLDALPDRVRTRLQDRLKAQLPGALVRRLLPAMLQQTPPVELIAGLRHGFPRQHLAETLYGVYDAAGFPAVDRKEVDGLGRLLEQTDHRLLRLLHASWTGSADRLRAVLDGVSPAEYRDLVRIALRFQDVSPLGLMVPGRAEAFLDVYLHQPGFAGYGLVGLVEALLAADEPGAVGRLAPYVAQQPPPVLRRLAKTVSQRLDHVPEAFSEALARALTALPDPPSKPGVLRSLLGWVCGSSRADGDAPEPGSGPREHD